MPYISQNKYKQKNCICFIIWWNGLFGFGAGFLITRTYYLRKKWQDGSMIADS